MKYVSAEEITTKLNEKNDTIYKIIDTSCIKINFCTIPASGVEQNKLSLVKIALKNWSKFQNKQKKT